MAGRRSGVSDDIDSGLLDRYLAGACTLSEQAAVQRWASGSAERAAMLDALRQRRAPDSRGWNTEASWLAAHARLRLGDPSVAPRDRLSSERGPANPARLPQPWPRWVGRGVWSSGRVAVLAAAAGVAVALFVELTSQRRDSSRAQLGREYVTAAGQRETATLPDGTQMTLAPATRAVLGAGYGRRERDVYLLDGEGYFAVAHDAHHPFVVHARNALATDVGTRFDVRAYAGDSAVRVVVAEGRVALNACRNGGSACAASAVVPTALGATDIATVAPSGEIATSRDADIGALTGWVNGQLVFRDASVSEIARALTRWYGVDITVPDAALAARRLTVVVHDEPYDQVVSGLALLLHARVERARGLVIRSVR